MHPFATDDPGRRITPLVLLVMSAALAWATNRIIELAGITPPWWIDIPAIAGWYAVLWQAFTKWCWRWRFTRVLQLCRVPDLGGRWKVVIQSLYGQNGTNIEAELQIRQTWREITISLVSDDSRSVSYAASLVHDGPDWVLVYNYRNSPRVGTPGTMEAHTGTAELRIEENGALDGFYTAGRGRGNQGRLTCTRQAEPVRVVSAATQKQPS